LAVLDQRDMHGPVAASVFAELPRAVKRVDDPDAGCGQPSVVVLALLREDCITGSLLSEQRGDQLMRQAIATVPEIGWIVESQVGAEREQSTARFNCRETR
jgi:hypothetical protein